MPRILLLLAVVIAAWCGDAASGAVKVGPNPTAVAFFEARIRPVLVEHCHECHAGAKHKGGLKVDSLEGLLAGGSDEGPAVVPSDPAQGSLLRALRWDGSDLQMPPKTRLPDAVIADIEHWIGSGAPWPDASAAVVAPAIPPPRPLLLGRIHPIIIHFPIACLFLAVVAELLVLFRGDRWRAATSLLVNSGAIGASAAVASGLYLAGDQPAVLLSRHELMGWLTLAGALTSAGFLLLLRWLPLRRWPLLVLLMLTALLVAITGHIGGQMSWGADWLAF